MLVAASVCPYPPLLIPELSRANPDWLVDLRSAVVSSVRRLTESGATRVIAIGAGTATQLHDGAAVGSLRRFGVDVSFGRSTDESKPTLPIALTVAAFLLDAVSWEGDRTYAEVANATDSEAAAEFGARLVAGSDRVGLLVMGDGSARRTKASPGPYDARAVDFDDLAFGALKRPDPEVLLGLEREVGRDLWVAGIASWQALAGAARASSVAGQTITTTTAYEKAPTGVGYLVVDWQVS